MIRGWSVSAILLVSVVFMLPTVLPSEFGAGGAGPTQRSLGPPVAWGPGSTPIKHIITVVMENRVYDNLFGSYCMVYGPYCSSVGNGLLSLACIPENASNVSAGCVRPYNFTARQLITPDIPHDWVSALAAYDNGTNLGFYLAEHAATVPFGEYNGSTDPIFWDMAEQYASSDNFFAANLSYSLPNHWYLLAGQAPPISYDSYVKNVTDRSTYLDEANLTSTIQDRLNGTNVSWKYYDYSLLPYNLSIKTTGFGTAFDYWNPLAGRAESYTNTSASHIVPRTDILSDLANGTLPDLSWVVPIANASTHPGYNITLGESWVAQLVDAVENSSYWNSTAIFVVWDDYGGWFDHVPPPKVLSKVLSFRSPILVISPYAKENYISSQFLDFFSLLRYDEWTFGIACMTPLDCSAPLPFDFFDYNGTARPPMLFPTDWLSASYPMPLQPPGAGPTLCPRCGIISYPVWNGADVPSTNPALGD